MNRYQRIAVLSTLWLNALLLGCNRVSDRKALPVSEARSDPVLMAEDDVTVIVAKAVKAYGGANALSRWRCGYLRYKTTGGAIPAPAAEVTFEDTFQLPGHFKRVTRTDVGSQQLIMVFVINHGKGWIRREDAPTEPIDNDFTEKTEHPFADLCNLTPLTEPDVRLVKLDSKVIYGKDVLGVRAQSDRFGEADLYFDTQTGLLVKSKKVALVPGADQKNPSVVESFFDEYKDVQGTQVPMRFKVTQDGKSLLNVTLIEARFAETIEGNAFAKP